MSVTCNTYSISRQKCLQNKYQMCPILGTLPPLRWNSTGTTVAGSATGFSGIRASLLNNPYSLTLDSSNALIITDYMNHRIQFFRVGQSNGTTIAGITGVSGSSATLLREPYWAVIDSQLNLYAIDTYNNRIQKFTRL